MTVSSSFQLQRQTILLPQHTHAQNTTHLYTSDGLMSALQVQTQPLTCVALVSWDWCTCCTLWWTQRLCLWLETSTSYRNIQHRYRQVLTEQRVWWMHVFYLKDNWFRTQLSLLPQRMESTPPSPGVVLCGWPWTLSSLQRELERKKENPPSGKQYNQLKDERVSGLGLTAFVNAYFWPKYPGVFSLV